MNNKSLHNLALMLMVGVLATLSAATIAQPAIVPPPEEPPAQDGQEAAPDQQDPADEQPEVQNNAQDAIPPGTMRFHLLDGTIITGRLADESLRVSTEFGDLVVPVTAIHSIAPGLVSHPRLAQRIDSLIDQLADPSAEARDQAQEQLLSYGAGLLPELQRYARDENAERRIRIATIIEEIYANQSNDLEFEEGPSVSLLRLDSIVTEQFTVAGQIQHESFSVESSFGILTVQTQDIMAALRVTARGPEVRRMIEVAGTDMTCRQYKNTGIRVQRGDRVIINAQGQITMTPWGGGVVSGPDGLPQNGMYNGTIPLGALAGRIGENGQEFLVGSRNSFVAQQTGTLHLAFAMQAQWMNYQYPGNFRVNVRVVPGGQ